MNQDRFNYNEALAESWKSQMLLNLVKIRYGDVPVFLDVGQIVAGYSINRSISLTGSVSTFSGGAPSGAVVGSWGPTVSAGFSDTPTVTYAPLAGEQFARSMMMPIPLAAVMSVVQANVPVDVVFRLAVQSMNGVDNRRVEPRHVRPANPEFFTLLADLRRVQSSGDLGVRLDRTDKEEKLYAVLRPNMTAAVEGAALNIAEILGLDSDAREFRVVYGSVPANDREIAVLTRSIREVLTDLASMIEVPGAHVAEHRVGPTPEADLGPEGPIPPMIRIAHSADRPRDAYAAASYRGYWFSIDDRDLASKNQFSFLMFLFTFVEPATREGGPVLTIPTAR